MLKFLQEKMEPLFQKTKEFYSNKKQYLAKQYILFPKKIIMKTAKKDPFFKKEGFQ